MSLDLPDSVVVGKNGAYWRHFVDRGPESNGSWYSMCPVSEDNDPVEPVATFVNADDVARLLFELGFPYDVQIRDSDGDVVLPPLPVMEALIDEWRLYDAKDDTPEIREEYRDSFAVELGCDPWEDR